MLSEWSDSTTALLFPKAKVQSVSKALSPPPCSRGRPDLASDGTCALLAGRPAAVRVPCLGSHCLASPRGLSAEAVKYSRTMLIRIWAVSTSRYSAGTVPSSQRLTRLTWGSLQWPSSPFEPAEKFGKTPEDNWFRHWKALLKQAQMICLIIVPDHLWYT